MSWLSRLGNVFRSSRLNQDLDDELRFHVQARAEELEREGLAPEAAEAEARRQLGNALRLREEMRRPPSPTVYVPWRGLGTLQVRTALDPLALAATLRPEIATVHPSLRVTGVNVQSTLVGNTLLRERLLALLSGFFATVGLVLAAVGLYGVLSYAVVQRTKEIGIRLALGARPLTVVRGVLAETGWMTLVGVAGGLAGGVYLARFLTTLLYEVRPLEPWSLGLPIGCLLAVGALAAVRPAWLAARVDPVVALRYE